MITISVNNEIKEIEESTTVDKLLVECGYEKKKIAVAVNTEFVSRAEYDQCFLKNNDKVDIVAPIQGG